MKLAGFNKIKVVKKYVCKNIILIHVHRNNILYVQSIISDYK